MTATSTATASKPVLVASRIQQMLPTTFAYCALVVVGALFELAGEPIGAAAAGAVGLGVAGMALVVWGQWFVNDVYDKETDRHSNPDRETTRGAITDREALAIGGVLVALGAAAAAALGPWALGSLAGYIVVNTAYSVPPLRTKAGAASSMLTLGTMGAFSILLGGAAVAGAVTPLSAKLAATVLAFMALTMSYKDLKDVEHDRKSGVENFAVRYGADAVGRALMVLLPASYVVEALVFGLYAPVPLYLALGALVVYLLYTWDGGNEIVYRLDAVNGVYLLSLGVAYYLLG